MRRIKEVLRLACEQGRSAREAANRDRRHILLSGWLRLAGCQRLSPGSPAAARGRPLTRRRRCHGRDRSDPLGSVGQ